MAEPGSIAHLCELRVGGRRFGRRMWRRLLEELEAAGHVERVDGVWWLTAETEADFGPALRALPESVFAAASGGRGRTRSVRAPSARRESMRAA